MNPDLLIALAFFAGCWLGWQLLKRVFSAIFGRSRPLPPVNNPRGKKRQLDGSEFDPNVVSVELQEKWRNNRDGEG